MADMMPTISSDDRSRLDELFSDLQDHSGAIEGVTGSDRAARRLRAAEILKRTGSDAVIVEPGTTMRYLTGVHWGISERWFALVLTADGEIFWLVPGFEDSRAASTIGDVGGERVLWQEHEYPYAPLASALEARGVKHLTVEPWTRHRFVHGLSLATSITLETGNSFLLELRGVKEPKEIALLRRANELTQDAICHVAETFEPGISSHEIAMRLTVAQERLGLTGIWNLTLIGPAGAFPHGEDRVRHLEPGVPILIDTGGKLHGYCSDNTRSWIPFGDPSEDYVKLWNTVRDAQKAAFEAMRPGDPCGNVDKAARGALANNGWSDGYEHLFHRLGHGIGMDGHEDPYFDSGSDVPMAAGHCFSNEPGIYLPGDLGLRLEDIVTVTADGADHFGMWQAGPDRPHSS